MKQVMNAILVALLGAGCSTARHLSGPSGYRLPEDSSHGLVALSTRASGNPTPPNSTLYFIPLKPNGRPGPGLESFPVTSWSSNKQTTFDDPPGMFYVTSLKAGHYRFEELTANYIWVPFSTSKRLDLHFEVRPQETVYLGEILFEFDEEHNVDVQVSNQSSRDFPLFDQHMDHYDSASLRVRLPESKERLSDPDHPDGKNFYVIPTIGISTYTGLVGLEIQYAHVVLTCGYIPAAIATYGIKFCKSPERGGWYFGYTGFTGEDLHSYGVGAGYRKMVNNWVWNSGAVVMSADGYPIGMVDLSCGIAF